MLDILNSRGGLGPHAWECLFPKVSAALDLVTAFSTTRETWDFLLGLSAKVEWKSATGRLGAEA